MANIHSINHQIMPLKYASILDIFATGSQACLELPHVLVARVPPARPPELAEALLHTVHIVPLEPDGNTSYLKCCCTEWHLSFVFVCLFEDIGHWMHRRNNQGLLVANTNEYGRRTGFAFNKISVHKLRKTRANFTQPRT